jgi:hypothetical protein
MRRKPAGRTGPAAALAQMGAEVVLLRKRYRTTSRTERRCWQIGKRWLGDQGADPGSGLFPSRKALRNKLGNPMNRILYIGTKNASSWALRAWLAMREQSIEFEERLVDLRRPQRIAELARVAEFSPPAAVPVLVDDDVVIFDSLAIMEYASEIGDAPLPADARLRARTRSLVAWVHSGLSGICGTCVRHVPSGAAA